MATTKPASCSMIYDAAPSLEQAYIVKFQEHITVPMGSDLPSFEQAMKEITQAPSAYTAMRLIDYVRRTPNAFVDSTINRALGFDKEGDGRPRIIQGVPTELVFKGVPVGQLSFDYRIQFDRSTDDCGILFTAINARQLMPGVRMNETCRVTFGESSVLEFDPINPASKVVQLRILDHPSRWINETARSLGYSWSNTPLEITRNVAAAPSLDQMGELITDELLAFFDREITSAQEYQFRRFYPDRTWLDLPQENRGIGVELNYVNGGGVLFSVFTRIALRSNAGALSFAQVPLVQARMVK